MKRRLLFLIAFLAISLFLLSASAFAHDDAATNIDIKKGTAPNVDGVINPSEYLDASYYAFTGGGGLVEVWLKTDTSYNLYISFKMPVTNRSNESAQILLDTGHNGLGAPDTDDLLFQRLKTSSGTAAFGERGTGTTWDSDPDHYITNGWTSASTIDGAYWFTEFKIEPSLTGFDSNAKTIGLALGNVWTAAGDYFYPNSSYTNGPGGWANGVKCKEQALPALQDNTIFVHQIFNEVWETEPYLNKGELDTLCTGLYTDISNKLTSRILIKPDKTSLPAIYYLDGSALNLYVKESGAANSAVQVNSLKKDWSETESNWEKAKSDLYWQTLGAGGSNDIGFTISTTNVNSGNGWYKWALQNKNNNTFKDDMNGYFLKSTNESTANAERYYHSKESNVSKSPYFSVSLYPDSTAPSIEVNGPVNNSWVKGLVNFTVKGQDGQSGMAEKVGHQVPGSTGSAQTNLPYTYNWNTADIPDGLGKNVSFYVYDRAGNSTGYSRTYKVDNTAPIVSSLQSTSHPVPGTWYSNRDYYMTWDSSDYAGSEVSTYAMALDNNPLTIPDESWQTSVNNNSGTLGDGDHWFHVKAKDNVGNWGLAQHVNFKVDTTEPSIPVSALSTSKYYRGKITLNCTANDSLSDINNIDVFAGNNFLGDAPFVWDSAAQKFSGIQSITFKAYDLAGNNSDLTREIKVDNTKPKTSGTRKAVVRKGYNTKLYWKVSDDYTGNKAYVTIRIRKGTRWVKTIKVNGGKLTAINTLKGTWYRAALSRGTYKYYVYATDQAGNKQYKAVSNYLIIR